MHHHHHHHHRHRHLYADKRFIPQFRFRLEPFRYNAYSYYAFGPPCRLVLLSP